MMRILILLRKIFIIKMKLFYLAILNINYDWPPSRINYRTDIEQKIPNRKTEFF